jgi:hypothetical protein
MERCQDVDLVIIDSVIEENEARAAVSRCSRARVRAYRVHIPDDSPRAQADQGRSKGAKTGNSAAALC